MTKKYIEQYAKAKEIVEHEPAKEFTNNNEKLIHFVMLGMNSKGRMKAKVVTVNGKVYRACVEHWLKVVHPDWSFSAVDGRSLKFIITQIESYAAKNGKTLDEDGIVNFFRYMCNSLPSFYKSQNLNVINNKFDSIIFEIKNGRKKENFNSKNSADRFSDFAGHPNH